jgi:hypothetical protein
MTRELHFALVFGLTAVYVMVGNYLYFCKVLPSLEAPPNFLPTSQWRHVKKHLELLDIARQHPWYYAVLKWSPQISLVLGLFVASLFVRILFGA